jgi:hypothetical protein
MPQMFGTSRAVELFVYARCNDLAGLAQCIELSKPLAARYPGWLPVLLLGEGSFQLVRGDYEAARAKLQAGIELDLSKVNGAGVNFWTWMTLHAELSECLLAMGHTEEARATASAGLRECEARGTGISAFALIQALALAEAKLGDSGGVERLGALIARQNALGASGLRMGLSYEARARVAIWSGDAAAFEHFSELTAREYRHGAGTSLAARYERLMNEAARAGMQAKLTLEDFRALASTPDSSLANTHLVTIVTRAMSGHRGASKRAHAALQMICAAYAAHVGYLFLFTATGTALRASQGSAAPPPGLAELVADYLSKQQQYVEELDEMVTAEDDRALASALEFDGCRHELLPLRCVVEAASVLVGVAVIAPGREFERTEHQTQLLTLLAANLLESGGPLSAA